MAAVQINFGDGPLLPIANHTADQSFARQVAKDLLANEGRDHAVMLAMDAKGGLEIVSGPTQCFGIKVGELKEGSSRANR